MPRSPWQLLGTLLCIIAAIPLFLVSAIYAVLLTDKCPLFSLDPCDDSTTVGDWLLIVLMPLTFAASPFVLAAWLRGYAGRRTLLLRWSIALGAVLVMICWKLIAIERS